MSNPDEAPRLSGKVAIVTGGASGMGKASALEMAHQGAKVVVADIDEPGGQTVAQQIDKEGGAAAAIRTDVGEESDVAKLVSFAVETFGRLDVLHNNASILTGPLAQRDTVVTDMEVEVWDAVFRVNLRGQMLGCKHAIPEMLKVGGGSVVNVSSIGAFQGGPALCAYGTSKAGVNALTLYVASTYGKQGIRCNAIAPGTVLTPPTLAAFGAAPAMQQLAEDNHLTPRLGEPEDVAKLVAFLASDDSAYITGTLVPIDGGVTAHWPQLAQMNRVHHDT